VKRLALLSLAFATHAVAQPTARLVSPAPGTQYLAPASISIVAQTGVPAARVEFLANGDLIGTATATPYTFVWSNVPLGTHVLRARVVESNGQVSQSPPVPIQVTERTGGNVNAAPTVNLTSPAPGTVLIAPANIALAAEGSDADGSIVSVDFFFGDTLITTRTAPPYGFTWTGVPAGTYLLTARITDNLGASVTSAAVPVTVKQAVAQLYYIHVDHLNTARLVANQQAQTVWKWDQQEPFGANATDENPSGLGAFEFPLRFPGQYFDKETNLHYNKFRDYDARLGTYKESDLVGLRGGMNTYAYAGGNPLMHFDAAGLAYFAYRPIQWMPFGFMLVNAALSAQNKNVAHEHLFFEDGLSPPNLGFGPGGLFIEPVPMGYTQTSGGFDDCIMRIAVLATPVPPSYGLFCENCQYWASNVRAQYAALAKDPAIQEQCRCTQPQPVTSAASSTNKNPATAAATAAAVAAAAAAMMLLLSF
jgi:RHS repeat-associated protein